MVSHDDFIPAQTSPGQTRSALSRTPGESEKLARGSRIRVGSANVGSMSRRSGEVSEMARRRSLDFCCLQETRWKGEGVRQLGSYKFFWKGCRQGLAGVGILVSDKWTEKVLEVKRISERIMLLRVIVGKSVINIVSVYAPQSGLAMEEKEEFYISLGRVLSLVDVKERLIICGDMNGHVGAETDGFEGVHGGHGFGSRNVEGEMLLEFTDAMDLVVANTWFKKSDGKLITYESGGFQTVVDYILVRKAERHQLRNVTVIRGESCMQQHKLLVCMMDLNESVRKKGRAFVSKCRVWRLRDPLIRKAFQTKVEARLNKTVINDGGNVDVIWDSLRDCLLNVADDVCGKTKGGQRHSQTWWWNAEVENVIKEKQRLYKIFDKSKNTTPVDKKKVDENKRKYDEAKRIAKKAVSKAKEAERQKFGEMLDEQNMKGSVFRVAKQMVRHNRDIVGEGCVKNTDGKIVVDEDKQLEVWRAYYDKLSNEEFPWNKETLTEADMRSGPCENISLEEVRAAVKKMKINKAPGPSGVVADMLKAAGETGLIWLTDVCNAVVKEGRVPKDWCHSWMVNVYKGKGDALECGSYRGIRLLEHAMKVFERVIEARVRKIVKIDSMQFGFMPGRGTTDAIFIVRQLQEKYLARKKELWMAFIDLEKAFDRVPREVLWWALRKLGVDEWLVSVIKVMYTDATTMVKQNCRVSKGFKVKVGVHQGSVLSPLLFIVVLEALSRAFRRGLPMELFYADDLILMADTENLLIECIKKWKAGMEEKGFRVNMGKSKVMRCRVGAGHMTKSGRYPCAVCQKGVGSNSIMCTSCDAWCHKRCSGVSGRLQDVLGFRCKICMNGGQMKSVVQHEVTLGTEGKLECVERFRYLGDVIEAGGGADEASRARVRSAWAKFKELSPVLTSRGASLKVKGKVYKACVQRVLVYGSETWPMKIEDMHRLERAERMMVRWMCGVTLGDRIASDELNERLGVERVMDVVRRGRLRWFGHLERKDSNDWTSSCRNINIDGKRDRGRGRKTWDECVRQDLKSLGLTREWAQDRAKWRGLIGGKRPTCASMEDGR